eukprot:TRINITY_DN26021_c0_g1_i1.p1 TRINITY_DN26021_c0_g1~~TRINITY_DN26021_c0_g1_i1.p1  ORF type:complete len:286 (+),score=52.07 TRINITY_DN26021_c0_g1_i1:107-964(+)
MVVGYADDPDDVDSSTWQALSCSQPQCTRNYCLDLDHESGAGPWPCHATDAFEEEVEGTSVRMSPWAHLGERAHFDFSGLEGGGASSSGSRAPGRMKSLPMLRRRGPANDDVVVRTKAADADAKPECRRCPLTGQMAVVYPACDYSVDANDAVDVELVRHLNMLDAEGSAALLLRRLSPGVYQIDDRLVRVCRSGPGSKDFYVVEEGVLGGGAPLPLEAYIRQSASIAVQLQPQDQRRNITFGNRGVEIAQVNQAESHGAERFEWMQVAVNQAKIRELASKRSTR